MENTNPATEPEAVKPVVTADEGIAGQPKEDKSPPKLILLVILFILVVLILSIVVLVLQGRGGKVGIPGKSAGESLEVKKFSSNTEFKDYLSRSASSEFFAGSGRSAIGSPETMNLSPGGSFGDIESPSFDSTLRQVPDRVSETNVQVFGIDEPDIVKTDGINIFYSKAFGNVIPIAEQRLMSPDYYNAVNYESKIIVAFPPEKLELLAELDESGEMLLFDNILVVFSGNKIIGYNVSEPKSPVKKWTQELEDNSYLVSSRSLDDKLYVVTKTSVRNSSPCPLPVMKGSLTIPCTDIYYPNINSQSDSTFSIVVIDPDDGSIENKGSFLGKEGVSLVYASKDYIYVTFTYYESFVNFMIAFLKEAGEGIVSSELVASLEKVASYDISEEAKLVELTRLTENYYQGLSNDERRKIENDLQNKMEDYMEKHSRDLEKSGVARFDAKNLKVSASESIPGTPLNQFSIDEFEGYLRIATTTSNSFTGRSGSTNDIYVLDKDLKKVGSVTDLGLTERIYSARFVADKGYLVTFRQIDPFYVLDLSDPRNPKKVGELKIPGYSSYLHPINKDTIVGVGQEGSNVKISLFDVTNPTNPSEVSKYDLDEFWSDVASNHHAFLLDADHKVFFMPAGANGYIFSYNGNVVNLQRVVTGIQARRALYIDEFMYILGGDKVVVLNENTWEEVKSLDF